MESLDVLNWNGEKVSKLNLDSTFFSEQVDKPLLHEIVKWQLARKRQGTHKAKTRSEVSGGGAKPFRQKGTGNARQGSIRSPLNEAGGVIHGPQPRSYDWALPKKLRKKALKQVVSHLLQEKNLLFVENMTLKEVKTKTLSTQLKKMKLDKALLVDKVKEENFALSCKNLKNFKFIAAEGLNVYDLLKFNKVLFTPSVLDILNERCGKVASKKSTLKKSESNKEKPATKSAGKKVAEKKMSASGKGNAEKKMSASGKGSAGKKVVTKKTAGNKKTEKNK